MTVFDEKLAFPRLGLAAFDKIEDIYRRSIPPKEVVKVFCGARVEGVDDRDWLLVCVDWELNFGLTFDRRTRGHLVDFLMPHDGYTTSVLDE